MLESDESMSTQKTKQKNRAWVKKFKVKVTQNTSECSLTSIKGSNHCLSAPMIISKERQPENRAEQKGQLASK